MRIVLVNTVMETSTFPKIGFLTPPYWAAVLASKINDREKEVGIKHEKMLLDMQFHDPSRRIPKIPKKYYEGVDAVFVSGMIQNYPQMIKISKFYRSRNRDTKIIFGGWGVTSLYHERGMNLNEQIFQFCDAAVIGEAEVVLTELLEDLEQKKLRQNDYYIGDPAKWGWVMPDFTIWEKGKYPFGAIQTQRGCPEGCRFCSVTNILGQHVRAKPVYSMVRHEIKLMQQTHNFDLIFFYDDNVIGGKNGEYARKLFTMFESNFRGVKWFSQCTTRLLKKPDLMDLFRDSGCVLLLFGFESLMQDCLKEVETRKNNAVSDAEREKSYRTLVEELNKRKIATWGCFIYGFEHDKKEIFERTLDFARKSGILIYQGTLLTPQPGTPLFADARGRLCHKPTPQNWGYYDFMQPTLVRHTNSMPNEELMAGFKHVDREFYRNTKKFLSMVHESKIPKSTISRCIKGATKGFFRRLLRM